MMTLTEAIGHCKGKAENLMRTKFIDAEQHAYCIACANEHMQLKNWLEELRDIREWQVIAKPMPHFEDGSLSHFDIYCPHCNGFLNRYAGVYEHEITAKCPNCNKDIVWYGDYLRI